MTSKRFFLSRQAALDIEEITGYIAQHSINNAIKFADELMDICRSISDFPEKGRIVPEVGHPLIREIIYKNYRIVYTIRERKIFILQVFNAARLFRMLNIKTD